MYVEWLEIIHLQFDWTILQVYYYYHHSIWFLFYPFAITNCNIGCFSGRHFWMLPILCFDRPTPVEYLHDRLSCAEHANQVCRCYCWGCRCRLCYRLDSHRCRSNRDLNPNRNAGYSFVPVGFAIRCFLLSNRCNNSLIFAYCGDENTSRINYMILMWC